MDHTSFKARQKILALTGLAPMPLTIAYTDVGAGEPVLLLHGIPTWSYLYHDVIPLLEPHCRVLAPDFLGHGYSDRRDRFDRSLRAQRDMILKFLDAVGVEKITVVGHDSGGGVALIMGIENPDRVGRLVLTNVVAYDSARMRQETLRRGKTPSRGSTGLMNPGEERGKWLTGPLRP